MRGSRSCLEQPCYKRVCMIMNSIVRSQTAVRVFDARESFLKGCCGWGDRGFGVGMGYMASITYRDAI